MLVRASFSAQQFTAAMARLTAAMRASRPALDLMAERLRAFPTG